MLLLVQLCAATETNAARGGSRGARKGWEHRVKLACAVWGQTPGSPFRPSLQHKGEERMC